MPRTYETIAAVGSSFAAGPGIEPVVDRGAGRSGANYAHLLAEKLDARLVDVSVSGATTATVLDEPQRMLLRRFEPQLLGVPTTADLVTVTVGGNDLRFAGSMLAAVMASRAESRALTRPLRGLFRRTPPPAATEADIERTAAGIARVASALQLRAPGARVILVDYLTILAPSTVPATDVPLSADEIVFFSDVQAGLQEAFRRASRDSGAELLPASVLSADHGLGSPEPWVFGYRGRRHLNSVFHPNQLGMRAIADALHEVASR